MHLTSVYKVISLEVTWKRIFVGIIQCELVYFWVYVVAHLKTRCDWSVRSGAKIRYFRYI